MHYVACYDLIINTLRGVFTLSSNKRVTKNAKNFA